MKIRMGDDDDDVRRRDDSDGDTGVIVETRPSTKKPSM